MPTFGEASTGGRRILSDCISPTFDVKSRGRSVPRASSTSRDAISRPGIYFSNAREAASSWQHDFRSAAAEPEFAERRGEDDGDGDDDDDVSGGEGSEDFGDI